MGRSGAKLESWTGNTMGGRRWWRRKRWAEPGDKALFARGGSFLYRSNKLENQNLAVGMKRTAGCGSRFFQRIAGREVRDLRHQSCAAQCLFDVVALQVDIGIDLVGDAVVALIFLEANVVSSGAYPQRVSVDGEGSLPDAKVVARGDHCDGLGVGPAIVLGAPEKVQRAHRHGKVRLLGDAGDNAGDDGRFHVGV